MSKQATATAETVTERIGKYLSVRKRPADPKRCTYRWTVLSNNEIALGVVVWFAGWRQYCFEPRENTTFNNGCLCDLAAFLERVNRERREERNKRKLDLSDDWPEEAGEIDG